MSEQPLFILPLKLATNPGGPGDQPAFPSVVDSSERPHGANIVAQFFGTSEAVKAQGQEFLMRVNTHDELVDVLDAWSKANWLAGVSALAKTQQKEI